MATKKNPAASKPPVSEDEAGNEHRVLLTAGPIEMPKQQAALTLDVHDTSGKLGTLKVSRGSLSWKVGKQKEQRLSWPQVAAMFKARREAKSNGAGKGKAKAPTKRAKAGVKR